MGTESLLLEMEPELGSLHKARGGGEVVFLIKGNSRKTNMSGE